jgi:hypothetical protein
LRRLKRNSFEPCELEFPQLRIKEGEKCSAGK